MEPMSADRLIWHRVTGLFRACLILGSILSLSSCGGYTRLTIKEAFVSEAGGAERRLQPVDVPIQSIPQAISVNYASVTSKFQEVQFDEVSLTLMYALSGEKIMDAADHIDLDVAITNKRDEAINVDWQSIDFTFEDPPETEFATSKKTRHVTFTQQDKTIRYTSHAENAPDGHFSVAPKSTGTLDMRYYRPCPRKATLIIGVQLTANGDKRTVTFHLAPK